MKYALLTLFALVAFAANSLLARGALQGELIDPVSFATLRLLGGAAILYALFWSSWKSSRENSLREQGSWLSAVALFLYAVTFSVAYVWLDAGVGALIMFTAVQLTMMLGALLSGERFRLHQSVGYGLGCFGLVYLFWPGATAPNIGAGVLMGFSGIMWGVYSMRGRRAYSPFRMTTGNFVRTIPMAVAASLLSIRWLHVEWEGVLLALLSGALASGLGYVVWYQALEGLSRSQASVVQLLVPVIASVGGIVFLSEVMSSRLLFSSLMIVGGVAMALISKEKGVVRD